MKAGKAMGSAIKAAKKFFKGKAGKKLLAGVKNAGKAAKAAAKKAKAAVKKKAKKVAKKAKKAAKKLKFWKKKRLAQVTATSDAAIENSEAEALLLDFGKISKVAEGVAEVMLNFISKTPFSDKLDASKTIVDFI